MADEKTYTESEHFAVLNDRLAKETADLTVQVDELTASKTELESKLDVAESAKVAAEQRATEAEKALEDFKAEIEQEREAAARKDERISKLREGASHLGDEFFENEDRVKRIVAMSDDEFNGYAADLSVTGSATPGAGVPRETAMSGSSVKAPEKKTSNGRAFLLGRYTPKEG